MDRANGLPEINCLSFWMDSKGKFSDMVISVADVDLIYLGLKVLLSSVETMEKLRGSPFIGPMQEAK